MVTLHPASTCVQTGGVGLFSIYAIARRMASGYGALLALSKMLT